MHNAKRVFFGNDNLFYRVENFGTKFLLAVLSEIKASRSVPVGTIILAVTWEQNAHKDVYFFHFRGLR